MNKEYKITGLFGSYQIEIGNNKLFYDVDKDIVNIIQTLQQENEKLNHYKLLYQKVKERNDLGIERLEALILFWKKYNPVDNHMQVEQFKGVIDILRGENNE